MNGWRECDIKKGVMTVMTYDGYVKDNKLFRSYGRRIRRKMMMKIQGYNKIK